MPRPLVSVVIPTIGRDSLRSAIDSALAQGGVEVEVIAVAATPEAAHRVDASDDRVRVISTEHKRLAVAGRTVGMGAARGQFVAFLDDDDMYLPGHLERATRYVTESPDTIYACRGLVMYEDRTRLEPSVTVESSIPIEYLFPRSMWRSRRRRVLTPSLVFHTRWADIPMVPALGMGGDTRWLLDAQQRGARLHVDPSVGILVNGNMRRDGARTAQRDPAQIGIDLHDMPPGSRASAYIGFLGRDAARAGDVRAVFNWMQKALKHDPSLGWVGVGLGYSAMAAGIRTIRAVRR